MPPLHEILPFVNLAAILFLSYELRKHHYTPREKDKPKDDR